MSTVIVSAPGKVILHGEHAVVFGKRALAGSLGLRTELKLQLTDQQTVVVDLPNIDLHLSWTCTHIRETLTLPLCDASCPVEGSPDVLSQLRHFAGINEGGDVDTKQLAVVAFLYLFCSISPVDGVLPSIEIVINSSLPTSAGLGSSAAFSTCLATSLLVASGHIKNGLGGGDSVEGQVTLTPADLDLVNRWSFMAEKIIHGRPSGIDNAVSTFGGAIFFQSGKIEPFATMPKFRVLLVNTRVGRSTKQLVEGVRQKHDRFPSIIGHILESIEAITGHCESTLAQLCMAENVELLYRTLEELIDMNQQLLNILGVGHASLDTVCTIASQFGLHAKLTGAGGGGCAFVLVPPYVSESCVVEAVKQIVAAGFDCFETSIGGPGVTVHVTATRECGDELRS